MNKQIYNIIGVSESDYLEWCKKNNKPSYKSSTKKEFFKNIYEGKLIRDAGSNLIIKRKRK